MYLQQILWMKDLYSKYKKKEKEKEKETGKQPNKHISRRLE